MAKLIYVGGAISAPTAYEREINVRRAEALSLELEGRGFATICVHTQSRFAYDFISQEKWLESCITKLKRCDAMAVVNRNFRESKGTLAEMKYCADHNIRVFVVDDFASLGDILCSL